MIDVRRIDGPQTYQDAIVGGAQGQSSKGVDRKGATMTYFIGTQVLPEQTMVEDLGRGKMRVTIVNPLAEVYHCHREYPLSIQGMSIRLEGDRVEFADDTSALPKTVYDLAVAPPPPPLFGRSA